MSHSVNEFFHQALGGRFLSSPFVVRIPLNGCTGYDESREQRFLHPVRLTMFFDLSLYLYCLLSGTNSAAMSGANPQDHDQGGDNRRAARAAPYALPQATGINYPSPSYGRFSNAFQIPPSRGTTPFTALPAFAQTRDETSRDGWLTRADREARWDYTRAEANRLRPTHLTVLQRDNRNTFWGVNMEQCRIPWSELRNSEVPPQLFLIYNPRTGEHDCYFSFDVEDRRWMD